MQNETETGGEQEVKPGYELNELFAKFRDGGDREALGLAFAAIAPTMKKKLFSQTNDWQ